MFAREIPATISKVVSELSRKMRNILGNKLLKRSKRRVRTILYLGKAIRCLRGLAFLNYN